MKKKMLCTIIIVVVNLFLLRHTAVANNFLQITELFPNPIGRDTGKEWIELFNNSNKTINLKGWKIKSSSKKTAVKDIDIKSKSYLTIPIQLKNTSNSVEIYDPTGKIISQVKYDEAQEGLSFSNTKTKWLWTKPTKGVANQKIIELKGNITTTPQIGKEFYFFLEDKKIIFEEIDFNFHFMRTSLKKGSKIKALVVKENYKLKEFQLLSTNQKKEIKQPLSKRIYLLPPLLSLLVIFIAIIRLSPS